MSKIGIIVEGPSDEYLLKNYYKAHYDLYVVKTKITNKDDIKNTIESMLIRFPSLVKILTLVDLDTKNPRGGQFTCCNELLEWYRQKVLKVSGKNGVPIEIVIAVKEIESWMLTNWGGNTDNKSKEDLKRKMQTVFDTKDNLTEMDMVKRFIIRSLAMNSANNKSLKEFEDKIFIAKKQ